MNTMISSPITLANSNQNAIYTNDINNERAQQILQPGSSDNSITINQAFNDYTDRFRKFIKLYGLIHVVAYILFNLIIIILQIVLTVALSINIYGQTGSNFNIYSGFWVI
jgi:hypothetical protein